MCAVFSSNGGVSPQASSSIVVAKKKIAVRSIPSSESIGNEATNTNGSPQHQLVSNMSPPPSASSSSSCSSSSVTMSRKPSKDANPMASARRFIQIVGHTTYVYCLCFDRTGKYFFTVKILEIL